MSIEIERKYIVALGISLLSGADRVKITQGYFDTDGGVTVRVRVAGKLGFITVKGPKTNFSCLEFEYEIPVEDALQMLDLCKWKVEKIRYTIYGKDGKKWDVDIFTGENKDLVLAEIELESEDEEFDIPFNMATEVSKDYRFSNFQLAKNPRPSTGSVR